MMNTISRRSVVPGVGETSSMTTVLYPSHRTHHHVFPFPIFQRPNLLRCRSRGISNSDDDYLSPTSAYEVLGLNPTSTSAEVKAAFRAKVKEFHPDVRGKIDAGTGNPDTMIRRVIQAYEILSNCTRQEVIETECLDPFDNPECEALDVFVNESLCVGEGCAYSCVKQAPHAFKFSYSGKARATSQVGHGEDYQVQRAVGQCPRNCIHYVTPSQRVILEELLDGIVDAPYDTSAEAELLYSLIVKAMYENNRWQKPKKEAKASTKHVDWF